MAALIPAIGWSIVLGIVTQKWFEAVKRVFIPDEEKHDQFDDATGELQPLSDHTPEITSSEEEEQEEEEEEQKRRDPDLDRNHKNRTGKKRSPLPPKTKHKLSKSPRE